jgi:methylmalonyl-CoA mutase C-terminal domain/subunit
VSAPKRVLVAKPGLDGHDRGAKVVARALRAAGATEVVVFGGGVIPQEDIPELQRQGIEKVFLPGTDTAEIVAFLRARLGA